MLKYYLGKRFSYVCALGSSYHIGDRDAAATQYCVFGFHQNGGTPSLLGEWGSVIRLNNSSSNSLTNQVIGNCCVLLLQLRAWQSNPVCDSA